ncbi:hypothetical protein [Microvirga sp. VF16]|uniref:hypothetical protein n=1 Tax=Microvirga sp. VF16 TaxID=2807101 RepID=UPI00193E51AE|nr:hypothetical protein [Microvirga sp. VF16]QRM27366.1 hypothetical protein JO965_13755 [Microvirga sp. VF16]
MTHNVAFRMFATFVLSLPDGGSSRELDTGEFLPDDPRGLGADPLEPFEPIRPWP